MQRGAISSDQDDITRDSHTRTRYNAVGNPTTTEDGYTHHHHPLPHPRPHQYDQPPLHLSNTTRVPIPIAPRRAPSTGSPPMPQPKARKRQRAPTAVEPSSPVSLPQTSIRSPNAAAGPSVIPPAVLVRDKKPKACANCRRAKLKCMVDDGETDCVRCKSRQDACIFYPRGNDEDWQSTLTIDVYSVTAQMGRITQAVSFMMTNLEGQGVIPPWPGLPALMGWQEPQRDVDVLQGWRAAEKQREENGEDARAIKKSRNSRPPNGMGVTNADVNGTEGPREDVVPNHRFFPSGPSGSGENRYDPPAYPPQQELQYMPPQAPATSDQPLYHHQGHPQDHSIPAYLTRTNASPYSNGNPAPFDYSGVDIPIPALPPIPELPTIPASFTEARPLISPSISITSNTHLLTPVTQPSGSPSMQSSAPIPAMSDEEEVIQRPLTLDPEGEPIYGSDDNRPDVVNKGIVSPAEAKFLVAFFHSSIAPSLYGYGMQLGSFPYHQDGPRRITPFILAVQCYLAVQLLPQLAHLTRRLADEVLAILLDNPADSWQAPNSAPSAQQHLFAAFSTSDDVSVELFPEPTYDKEYGLGPEEIVGMCLLTAYVGDDRRKMSHIAKCAFTWARGWLDEIGQNPEYKTVAEDCGVVPALRKAQESDKARLWLLCYIIEGTELLVMDPGPPIQFNPQKHCNDLIQSLQTAFNPLHPGSDTLSPNDILLIFHARLVHLRREWQVEVEIPCPPNSTPSLQVRRLITRANDYLSIWKSDLDSYNLPEEQLKQIEMNWLWAKLLVNQKGAKITLREGKREARQRGGPISMGIMTLHRSLMGVGMDAAFEFLTRCAAFAEGRGGRKVELPQAYYNAILVAAALLHDTLTDERSDTNALSIGIQDVIPLLRHVAASLSRGNTVHWSGTVAKVVQDYANKLMGMLRA